MILSETPLPGIFVVDLDRKRDERGYFARTWCRHTAAEAGIEADWIQFSVSYNLRAGTLRGMHFQRAPHSEAKLVRCTRGAIHDVVIDLREASATYLRSFAIRLDADSGRALYIPPEHVAHGFLTLEDHSEVLYHMSKEHAPHAAAGYRWNDPAFGIQWPRPPAVIAPRDAAYPDFDEGRHG
jgi:dTDP-4-dehydrorhamnose 3,5-epimerase